MMASANDLIVVTSAGGGQCANLIPLLYDKYPLRLVALSTSTVSRLREHWPLADVRQADLTSPVNCAEVVRDAVVVYHIGPGLHPHEAVIGEYMIDACENERRREGAKFQHFIHSSLLNTNLRKMFNHDRKRYVDEYLVESELNYTILRPTDFLDWIAPPKMVLSTPSPAGGIQEDGTAKWKPLYTQPNPSTYTALRDLAEVGAKVIAEREKHYDAEYPLTSTPPLTHKQAVEDLGKICGRKVVLENPEGLEASADNIVQLLSGSKDGSPRLRDGAERLVLYYSRRGLRGNNGVMRWLLGREPTSHIDLYKAEIAKMKD